MMMRTKVQFKVYLIDNCIFMRIENLMQSRHYTELQHVLITYNIPNVPKVGHREIEK